MAVQPTGPEAPHTVPTIAKAPPRASQFARNWSLLRNLTRKEIRQRYKGSALGLLWTLINPIIAVAVYALVFRYLLRINIENYALFLFLGLAGWVLFYGSVRRAASSIVGNGSLVTRSAFPREIIPLSVIFGNAFTAVVMFAIAVPLCIALSPGSVWPVVLVLPLALCLVGMAIGLGLAAAALDVLYRDVEHVLEAIDLPWYFLTPIFYTYAALPILADGPAWVEPVLHYGNPVAPTFVALHTAVFFGQWPAPADLIYTAVFTALCLVVGLKVFRTINPRFARYL